MTTTVDRQAVVTSHFDAYAVNNRWGELYNRANPHSHSFLARRRKAVELAGALDGKKLLDIGCGTGSLVGALLETAVQYEGVDVAPQMIAVAERHLQECRVDGKFTVRVGSALNLPYPDNCFDAVVGMGLLEYFDDPTPVIREAIRVTKPGGRLIFNTPQKFSFDTCVVHATAPIRILARQIFRKTVDDIEHNRYTPKEFQSLFVRLGCRFVGEAFYNKLLLPYPVTRVLPRIAYGVARLIEDKPGFGFCATGYIVACEK